MPTISNATVATGTGLSTAGNGGRKLVRLDNGNQYVVARSGANLYLYKSTDNWSTNTTYLLTQVIPIIDASITTDGVRIWVIANYTNQIMRIYNISDSAPSFTSYTEIEPNTQSAFGNNTITVNDAKTEIHAAWSSKNSTYSSSFNIRYAKGTINGDGSVTWGAVEQVTIANTSTFDFLNPSIVTYGNEVRIFVNSGSYVPAENSSGSTSGSYAVLVFKKGAGFATNSSFVSSSYTFKQVYNANSNHVQSNPSSIFVPTAINGLANGRLWVAWHGKDATDSAKFNVRVSYSDDGGVTWATPVKLTSGNLYDRQNVSLAADKTGKVFTLYEEHQWSPDLDIYMRTFSGGSWGAPVAVAEAEPAAESNPSTLVDYSLQMTTPPFVFTNATDGVKFSGNFNLGASVSPASGTLGNKETATLTAYTVTPEAVSTVTSIVEKVNGVTVNTFNNPASLSRTLTVPTATWDTLAYFATHTASITVTDSNGAQTVTTYSFDKRLATGASLLEATKANTDAKNRISQKRDALAAQVGLSAGSTFDAISAQLASGTAYKKFATGTVTSGGSQLPFVYQTGSTLNNYFVTVSGLNFLPKTIIVFATSNQPQTFYVDGLRWNGVAGQDTLMSQTLNYFRTTGNLYVTDSGFRLPVSNTAITYSWIAYG